MSVYVLINFQRSGPYTARKFILFKMWDGSPYSVLVLSHGISFIGVSPIDSRAMEGDMLFFSHWRMEFHVIAKSSMTPWLKVA